MNNIDLLIILSTAFLGSVGHCIGMCGGIVVAYSSSKIDHTSSWGQQTISHLAYNFGRVTTYAILGAMFGLLGKAIAFTPTTKGVLFLLTGLLMILAGLSLVGNLKFLNSAQLCGMVHIQTQVVPQHVQKTHQQPVPFQFLSAGNAQRYHPLRPGLLLCHLCGKYGKSALGCLWGAIVMATFGLATIPALFFLGTVTKFLQKGSLRGTMMKLAAMLVIFYGFYTLYKGYKFISHPKETQQMIDSMQTGSIKSKIEGKCGGMKCAPGKCG